MYKGFFNLCCFGYRYFFGYSFCNCRCCYGFYCKIKGELVAFGGFRQKAFVLTAKNHFLELVKFMEHCIVFELQNFTAGLLVGKPGFQSLEQMSVGPGMK